MEGSDDRYDPPHCYQCCVELEEGIPHDGHIYCPACRNEVDWVASFAITNGGVRETAYDGGPL